MNTPINDYELGWMHGCDYVLKQIAKIIHDPTIETCVEVDVRIGDMYEQMRTALDAALRRADGR